MENDNLFNEFVTVREKYHMGINGLGIFPQKIMQDFLQNIGKIFIKITKRIK